MNQLPAPHVEYPADGSVMPVQRFIWEPEEAVLRAPGAPGRLEGFHLVVLGGTDEASTQVAAAVERRGARVSRVSFRSGPPILNRPGDRVDGIIDLNVGEPFSPARKDAWKEPLRQTVAVLKQVYDDWLSVTDTSQIFYMPVTRMDGQMGLGAGDAGDAGEIVQPLGGIWAGLAKTLPREIPNCNVKVLDLCPDSYARIGELVAQELYVWGLFEVGYRRGRRFQLTPRLRPVPAPTLALDASDVVLVSGGGRGIGFALARALARTFGCRVVITGRSAAPSGDEGWLSLDATGLTAYRNDRLKRLPPGRSVVDIRKEVEHIGRQIELHRHLAAAASEGVPIEYRVCDFTDARQVRALVGSIGPALSGIVHNAGVDAPKRLNGKSPDAFVETVAVKVDGFLAILDALDGRPLKFLTSVGSLTGRMGGMVGQLDYAAANDGLARLGHWAARATPYAVKTLCWPTWKKLGMIANYDATLKYMSALDIDEGLYHWQRDIVAGGSGEATFIGHFGKALSPVQLNGFPMIGDLPQSDRLFSHWFHLGQARSFRPFAHMRSANRIDRRTAPCLDEFSWQGRAAIPVSVLLELALSQGDWVVPEGYPDLRLEEVRNLRVALAGLDAVDGFECEKDARGQWQGRQWIVAVRMTSARASGRVPLAELTLVYGAGSGKLHAALPASVARHDGLDGSRPAGLRWRGRLFRFARWFTTEEGGLIGWVDPCPPSDLWSMPYSPVQVLPASHLENVVRCALQEPGQPDGAEVLEIARIVFLPGAGDCRWILRSRHDDTWVLMDAAGQIALKVERVSAAGITPFPPPRQAAAALEDLVPVAACDNRKG